MKDYIVRATAANAQIRAFAASTTELVEEARTRHNTSPVATAALGRLLTAGAMMGSMMKNPTDVLTLQVQCGGPIGGMTVTADSKGEVKGYVHNPDVMLPPNTMYMDKKMKVWKTKVLNEKSSKEPGTILKVDQEGIKVATKDNVILISEIQMPNKKRMEVKEFIKGNTLEVGNVLQ